MATPQKALSGKHWSSMMFLRRAVNTPENRKLSLQAARESIVLLKNDNHVLPLKAGMQRVAVVGPTAELIQSFQGNYNGPPPGVSAAGVSGMFTVAGTMELTK